MSVFRQIKTLKSSCVQSLLCVAVSFSAFGNDNLDPFASEIPPEKIGRTDISPGNSESERLNLRKEDKTPPKALSPNQKSETLRKPPAAKKIIKKKEPIQEKPPEPSFFQGRSELKVEAGLEHIATASFFQPSINFSKYTSDQILVPYLALSEQLYPSIKLSSGKSFLLSARPRISVLHERASKSNKKDQVETNFEAKPAEMFAVLTASSRFSLTVGKQNFQWGLAEMASPSNWLFKARTTANSLIKNPQSDVETRDIVRINMSAGQRFNLVAMVEYEAEKQKYPRIYSGRRGLLKPEISWNSGADFVGLIVGGAETQSFPFLGEYMSVTLSDAFTFYADAAHSQGGDVIKPVRLSLPEVPSEQPIIVFDQPSLNEEKINHEIVAGIRYTHENGTELRVEGYFNSLGLTAREIADVAMLEETSSQLVPLFFEPGAEYRSRRALLLAARRNGFGSRRKWSALFRYLKPLADPSGAYLVYGEYSFSDNAILFFAGGGYHGKIISESAFAQRLAFSVGHKYVW